MGYRSGYRNRKHQAYRPPGCPPLKKDPRANRKIKLSDHTLAPKLESMDGNGLPQNGDGPGVAGYREKERIVKYRWGKKKGARRERRRISKAIEQRVMKEGVE